MTTRLPAALARAAFLAALVSCHGGGPPTAAPSPTVTDRHRVTISEFKFTPPMLVVPVGTTVTWQNLDVVPHTVTSTTATDRFNSGKLPYRATFSYTFTTPGRFQYLCAPHPGMRGVIEVQ
jgi:plastocyanin